MLIRLVKDYPIHHLLKGDVKLVHSISSDSVGIYALGAETNSQVIRVPQEYVMLLEGYAIMQNDRTFIDKQGEVTFSLSDRALFSTPAMVQRFANKHGITLDGDYVFMVKTTELNSVLVQ